MKNWFNFNYLKGDLLGGLTAGIVALPLALAFGLQSGMGAEAGLYGAIFISFFAALFGGTNTQISGPTAPMTTVSTVAIAGIVASFGGNLERALPSILIVFLIAGLFQILIGFLKVGKYIRFIPYPVLSGFMTGIGIIILVTQLFPMLGYYPAEDEAFVDSFKPQAKEVLLQRILDEEVGEDVMVAEDLEESRKKAENIGEEEILSEAQGLAKSDAKGVYGSLKNIRRAVGNINLWDLIMCLSTIIIVYGFKRITKVIPSALVALLLVTVMALLFIPGYRTIGDIPSGFPSLNLGIFTGFQISEVAPFLLTALSLALLGAIDSLLTSVVADNMTKTKHNPDQELVGQGIGNSIAALFGGIPGAGATIRTVVNIDAGGKTRLSGMNAGVLLLSVLLMLGPLASKIPAAVLAGILITVGIDVMDSRGIKHTKQLPKSEVAVMIIVVFITVFFDLIVAVGVGLLLSSLLFMKKISDVVERRTEVAKLKEFSVELPWLDEGDLSERVGNQVYIKHLYGPLFFGFASRFGDMVKALPDVKIVIIRMGKVPYVDQSGLYAMENAVFELKEKGIKVVFTDLQKQPKALFETFELIPGLVPREYCFNSFGDAAEWLEDYLKSEPAMNLFSPV